MNLAKSVIALGFHNAMHTGDADVTSSFVPNGFSKEVASEFQVEGANANTQDIDSLDLTVKSLAI
jgi:hypothetical protein